MPTSTVCGSQDIWRLVFQSPRLGLGLLVVFGHKINDSK